MGSGSVYNSLTLRPASFGGERIIQYRKRKIISEVFMKAYIKTERLEIMPFRTKDYKDLAEILTNSRIKETYMILDFETVEALTGMVQKIAKYSLSDQRFERGIFLEDRRIGFVNEVDRKNGSIELGYVIHPSFWGRGYATEMLKAVIEMLLDTGLSRIITGAFEENTASIRVMQKCGMRKTDVEEVIAYRGHYHHCVYYSFETGQCN